MMRTRLVAPLLVLHVSVACQPASTPAPATSGQPAATAAAPPAGGIDVTTSDASAIVGAVTVQLSVAQRPIVAGQPRRFCVRTEVDALDVDLLKGTLAIEGNAGAEGNHYPLSTKQNGCYAADVTIPSAGRWFATVEGTVDDHPLTARFQFDVK